VQLGEMAELVDATYGSTEAPDKIVLFPVRIRVSPHTTTSRIGYDRSLFLLVKRDKPEMGNLVRFDPPI